MEHRRHAQRQEQSGPINLCPSYLELESLLPSKLLCSKLYFFWLIRAKISVLHIFVSSLELGVVFIRVVDVGVVWVALTRAVVSLFFQTWDSDCDRSNRQEGVSCCREPSYWGRGDCLSKVSHLLAFVFKSYLKDIDNCYVIIVVILPPIIIVEVLLSWVDEVLVWTEVVPALLRLTTSNTHLLNP